jgi:hypothetical protein
MIRPDNALTLDDFFTGKVKIGDTIKRFFKGGSSNLFVIEDMFISTPWEKPLVKFKGTTIYVDYMGEERQYKDESSASDMGIHIYDDGRWNTTNYCLLHQPEMPVTCYKIVTPSLRSLSSHNTKFKYTVQYKVGEWAEDKFDNGLWVFKDRESVEVFLDTYDYSGCLVFEAQGEYEGEGKFYCPVILNDQNGKITGTESALPCPRGSLAFQRVKLIECVGCALDKGVMWN